jgi:hypothetical protein
MSVIKTKRNFVCAYEPMAQDRFVLTFLRGSEERHLLSTQPIEQYEDAVDWARCMADQMACPIEVVPITASEFAARGRGR